MRDKFTYKILDILYQEDGEHRDDDDEDAVVGVVILPAGVLVGHLHGRHPDQRHQQGQPFKHKWY